MDDRILGDIAEYYDDFAPHYVPGWRSIEHYGPLVTDFLLRATTPQARVLDVGCGPGQLTANLPADVEVFGADVSPQMLMAAQEKRPEGRYEEHDFHDPFPAEWGSFDVVLTVGCLEFCRDLALTLRNLAAVCAPGAHVMIAVVEDRALGTGRREFSAEGLPGIDMFTYDATAQLAAITAAGFSPSSYRFVPAWRHEEYGYDVRYGLWELRRDS